MSTYTGPSLLQMTRRTFTARSSVLCLLGLVAVTACRPLFHRQISGKVLALQGAAHGMIGEKRIALTSAAFVNSGETIVSSEDTRLDLALLPGILVELAGNAEIEIAQLRLERDGDQTIHPMIARNARIRLNRGALIASIVQAQTDSHLFVETPDGTLFAGPARTMKVSVTGTKVRILSVRGKIAVLLGDSRKSSKIPAGYFAELPMTKAEPVAAASAGSEVQAEVSEVLSVEKRLLGLERKHDFDFKPW